MAEEICTVGKRKKKMKMIGEKSVLAVFNLKLNDREFKMLKFHYILYDHDHDSPLCICENVLTMGTQNIGTHW